MRIFPISTLAIICAASTAAFAQSAMPVPDNTEVFKPVPAVVTPGAAYGEPPSDAIVLFDGKSLDAWQNTKDHSPASWLVHDGIVTVNKATGDIQTKRSFKNFQLHIEWRIPADIAGEGQERGNSGIFLAVPNGGGDGFELQVLDSYNNATYVNGMAGSIYRQAIPLVNAARKPGEWQTYDVIWTAPTFAADGAPKTPAYATVFFNGVLVEDHFAVEGFTNSDKPYYKQYDTAPIRLQAHGDKSKPLSYRNIWVRDLP